MFVEFINNFHVNICPSLWFLRRPSVLPSFPLKNVKWSCYRSGVAQRVGRGIALLFHDRGTRRGWVVSSTPRPHFTPGKDTVPILQEAEWAPGPVWTGGKSRPNRDSIPNRPARSSVAIPTELPSPPILHSMFKKKSHTRKNQLMEEECQIIPLWQNYTWCHAVLKTNKHQS